MNTHVSANDGYAAIITAEAMYVSLLTEQRSVGAIIDIVKARGEVLDELHYAPPDVVSLMKSARSLRSPFLTTRSLIGQPRS